MVNERTVPTVVQLPRKLYRVQGKGRKQDFYLFPAQILQDGQRPCNKGELFNREISREMDGKGARKELKELKVAKKGEVSLIVYYNPKKNARFDLEPGLKPSTFFVIILAPIFLVIGASLLGA